MARLPYVEDYTTLAEGYRRSAQIDREEADGLDEQDPRRGEVLLSAMEFDSLAEAEERREPVRLDVAQRLDDTTANRVALLRRVQAMQRHAFRATLTATTNEYLADRLPCQGYVQVVERNIYGEVSRALFMPDPGDGPYTSFVEVPHARFEFRSTH